MRSVGRSGSGGSLATVGVPSLPRGLSTPMAVKTGYATAPPPLRAAKPPECAAHARRTAEFRSRKFLATCWENADNKFRYAGGCKGRVFLASEKFNPSANADRGFARTSIIWRGFGRVVRQTTCSAAKPSDGNHEGRTMRIPCFQAFLAFLMTMICATGHAASSTSYSYVLSASEPVTHSNLSSSYNHDLSTHDTTIRAVLVRVQVPSTCAMVCTAENIAGTAGTLHYEIFKEDPRSSSGSIAFVGVFSSCNIPVVQKDQTPYGETYWIRIHFEPAQGPTQLFSGSQTFDLVFTRADDSGESGGESSPET